MTRTAVTLFVETDFECDPIEAATFFRMALRQQVGDSVKLSLPKLGEMNFTVHQAMETGMAAGNGYLWMAPTGKAFPRPEEDEDEKDGEP